MASLNYRADIDGLRCVAVAGVVLYHANLGVSGGYVGVDVFFVISGFLISSIIRGEIDRHDFSVARFYERRVRRLFPAMAAMTLVTLAAATLLFIPPDLSEAGGAAAAALAFVSNVFLYYNTGYFNDAAAFQPFLHTWSLAVEEQFYIVFPIALLLASRWLPRRVVTLGIALAGAVSLALCIHLTGLNLEEAFYMPYTRGWELLAGALIAAIAHERPAIPRWAREALGAGGVAAILYALFAFSHETLFPGSAAIVPVAGSAAVILAGISGPTLAGRALALGPMRWVGKISYSLYLWHWPIIVFANYGAFDPLTPVQGLACAALSVAVAWASWRWVETPFRVRRIAPTRRGAFLWGGGMAGVALAASAALVALGGLPQRMPAQVAPLLQEAGLRHDRPECHGVTVARLRKDDLCTLGAEGAAPSFALIGDSHADALSTAVAAAAARRGEAGWQITWNSGMPLPGRRKLGRLSDEPEPAATLDFLRRHPDIRTVYLTGYWKHYATGYTYRHHGSVWVDDAYDGSGAAYDARALQHGLERFAAALPGRRIVVLDDVPTGRLLHRFARARAIATGIEAQPGLPRADYAAERATYEPVLRAVAAEAANLDYRPIFEELCGPDWCRMTNAQGRPMFRDGDHLSVEGAASLEPEIEALMNDAAAAGGIRAARSED